MATIAKYNGKYKKHFVTLIDEIWPWIHEVIIHELKILIYVHFNNTNAF